MTPVSKDAVEKAEKAVTERLKDSPAKSPQALLEELREELKIQGLNQEIFALAVFRLLNRNDVHLDHQRRLVLGDKKSAIA